METSVIGLTGGIGSGKTAVSDMFGDLGVPIIDTDEISRELTKNNLKVLSEIQKLLGSKLVKNNQLDRQALRNMVFTNKEALATLEDILHPRIRAHVKNRLSSLRQPYALVVVPLLVEKGKYPNMRRVLLVDCDEEKQITRVKSRSKLSRPEIERIMLAQASRKQRQEFADDIILNNDSISSLKKQVLTLHEKYNSLFKKNDTY